MRSGFSLHHFRFHLEPKAPLHMPAHNKGNVIRGGFGSTFRLSARAQAGGIVCHANCREPETCELRSVCPYTAVFQPFVPEGSEKISKNRDILPSMVNRTLEGADSGEMADAWKGAGTVEKRAIGGDQWTVEFDGESQERGVVKRKVKLFADSRRAL